MQSLTIRELRNRPGMAQEELARCGELLLTSNGKPVAVMLSVDDSTLDATCDMLRRARGQIALGKLRRQAAAQSLDKLSHADIDAEIRQARQVRRP